VFSPRGVSLHSRDAYTKKFAGYSWEISRRFGSSPSNMRSSTTGGGSTGLRSVVAMRL
jgi:predicted transcriptional regulator with HTH domain